LTKKILIIGGTGFIGYHLASQCIKKRWNVTSISSKLPKKSRIVPKIKYIICDIANKNLLKKKVNKPFDYVVNLGGYVDHSNKKKTYNSHFIGCKNLTEIFLKKKIKVFLQMGSSVEYGFNKSPHSEKMVCNVAKLNSVYGKSKLKATNYLLNLFKKKKFPVVILRLYLAYGPNQDINRFIPIIINGCLKNQKFPTSLGNQLRDFVHVSDVIKAIFKCFEENTAIGEIINIGSGKPRTLKQIILSG